MTGKELVHQTISFRHPPRIATSTPTRESDTFRLGHGPASDFEPAVEGQDQWGCVKANEDRSMRRHGYTTVHPLSDWGAYKDYRFPDPYAPGRFDRIELMLREGDPRFTEKFVYGVIGVGPVQLFADLLGFENFLVTLAEHPERVEALLERHAGYLRGIVDGFARYDEIDALILYDDQAMQSGPYFSMEWWRRIFKPFYKELFDLIHARGKKVMLHCCGNLKDHIAEFHELGVDILDNKQPLIWLEHAEAFRGRMTFHTCPDFVSLLDAGEALIHNSTTDLIKRLSTPAGGFIGTLNNMVDPNMPSGKIEAEWNAFRAFSWQVPRTC